MMIYVAFLAGIVAGAVLMFGMIRPSMAAKDDKITELLELNSKLNRRITRLRGGRKKK